MDTNMEGELDSGVESSSNHPNQQNREWAQHLADEALAAPQDSSNDERLPTDVLVVVAEALASERDLNTLAKLNIAGRHVHEGTMPVLYETIVFADERAFERLVKSTNPKDWKYTKYILLPSSRFLFVTNTTLALLILHLRAQTLEENSPSADDLLLTAFPRLTLLGSTDSISPAPPLNHDHPLHLTLYKPFKLSEILRACTPYRSDEKEPGTTFFGATYLGTNTAEGSTPNRPDAGYFCDIVGLDLRPGAFITRKDEVAAGMEGWDARFSGRDFRLDVAEDVDAPGVEETLRIVLDHLALRASKKMTGQNKEIRLKVKCAPRVLEKIIELYDARPCFLNFEVDLTAPVTKEDMKRYLLAFGSAYEQHWPTHARYPAKSQVFLAIQARAPALHPSWWEEYNLDTDTEPEHMWMQYHGNGVFGNDGNDFDEDGPVDNMGNAEPLAQPAEIRRNDERAGFVLTLSRDLMCREEHQDGTQFWSRNYHVAAPPPPAVPTNGQQPGPWRDAPPLSENQLRALLLAQVQAARRAQGQAQSSARPVMTPERVARVEAHLRQNPALVQQLMGGMNPDMLQEFRRQDGVQPLPDLGVDVARARGDNVDIVDGGVGAEQEGEENDDDDDDEAMAGNGHR
ncbi:hypothetical protein QFC21_005628 [Naganishia friedmannii]|uniref:Uncharacterized protein n=1 Tax=Naganishia friedmannii TaxID=89922 RepID=A0ACC2V8G8_9TREE|nr:hypothetical protein QFC21_005628 [Naganishia friedmannii]